jgi:competence protein ComEA
VHGLPAGARVADALAAAGGYSTKVDLGAASQLLNLARSLVDGEQIHVPAIGENALAAGSAGPAPSNATGGGGSGGGLVNLNTATPEELEALPGIGPVTVQKIVAARQEQPFTSLDDAVTRGVIDRGQLEDITALATAG